MSKSFDRRLIEKTIEIAQRQGGYNSRSLRVRWIQVHCGEPHGSKTYNLLGHALRKALEVAQNEQRICVAEGAGTEILTGTSLKAALDLIGMTHKRNVALSTILQTLNSVESWVKQKTDLMMKQPSM